MQAASTMRGKRVALINCINGCGALSPTIYEGVEIDICPICAGVWLDTRELPTIIETRGISQGLP